MCKGKSIVACPAVFLLKKEIIRNKIIYCNYIHDYTDKKQFKNTICVNELKIIILS